MVTIMVTAIIAVKEEVTTETPRKIGTMIRVRIRRNRTMLATTRREL